MPDYTTDRVVVFPGLRVRVHDGGIFDGTVAMQADSGVWWVRVDGRERDFRVTTDHMTTVGIQQEAVATTTREELLETVITELKLWLSQKEARFIGIAIDAQRRGKTVEARIKATTLHAVIVKLEEMIDGI